MLYGTQISTARRWLRTKAIRLSGTVAGLFLWGCVILDKTGPDHGFCHYSLSCIAWAVLSSIMVKSWRN